MVPEKKGCPKKVQRTANICRPNVYKINGGAAHRNISKIDVPGFSSLSPKHYQKGMEKKFINLNEMDTTVRCT